MYNEEQLEMGVSLMNQHGLPMSRMVDGHSDDCIFNALISTVEDGSFWYGDLYKSDIITLSKVAKSLDRDLIITSDTNGRVSLTISKELNNA